LIPILLSVFLSVVFVAVAVNGATTISTNISTDGNLTVNGNSTFGNEAADVNLFTGTLQATTTALFSGVTRHYETLALYKSGTAGTAVEGGIYYDSTNKVIQLYDGTQWYIVGTSTNGMTLANNLLRPSSLDYYLTVGTTTQSGLSVLTLEATTTAAIPLTIKGFYGQTADLLRLHNYAGSELFAIDKLGNASTTMISTTGNLWVGGALGVASTTPYVALGVTGTTTSSAGMVIGSSGTAMNQVQNGTCNVTPNAGTLLSGRATTTTCTVTGMVATDRVFLTPASLPEGLVLQSASSTAGAIQISIVAATTSSVTISGSYNGWSWMSIR